MILELRPTDETSKLVAEIFAALDGNQKFQLTVIEKKRNVILYCSLETIKQAQNL